MTVETKVVAPVAGGLAVAVVGLLAVFGVHLSEEQKTAALAIVVAALPIVHLALGYLAPHTPRPDLRPAEAALPAVPVVTNVTILPRPGVPSEPVAVAPSLLDYTLPGA